MKKTLLLLFEVIAFVVTILTSCDNSKRSSFNPIEEKEKVKNRIENVYSDLVNGAFTQGKPIEKLPFYNLDISQTRIMGGSPYGHTNIISTNLPFNIEINNISESTADVKYDVTFINTNGNEQTHTISMQMKKTEDNWQLNGRTFFGMAEN